MKCFVCDKKTDHSKKTPIDKDPIAYCKKHEPVMDMYVSLFIEVDEEFADKYLDQEKRKLNKKK